ncbi:hypothetical protein POM88_030049 [Heracleum sosnowskyi]|uniref:Uncharacterized protein n=1 Tax=Heracleum sosnowskyi TaxID=360622 RepID=A0AAD8HWA2_9APIA|nr:hypothetical protein POM88_030049 [Heracleum sosnowskyi]
MSPRFSPITSIIPSDHVNPIFSEPPIETMFAQKIPKSTARRKGLTLTAPTLPEDSVTAESSATGKRSTKRIVCFSEEKSDENQSDKDDDFDFNYGESNIPSDEEINTIPKVKDNWKHGHWHDFVDNDDDDEYYQRLYKNGELCEEQEFGKINLKP